MKKLVFAVLLVVSSVAFTSCSGGNKTEKNSPTEAQEQYQCPMKCTEEISNKPGKCSVCEMDLEKVNNG